MISSLKISAVIFDLDGVILDSMRSHAAAWRRACLEIGLDLEEKFFLRHEGNLDWDILKASPSFQPLAISGEGFKRLLVRQREIYMDEYSAGVRVFPRASRVLDLLAGLKLALVTSSTRQVFPPLLTPYLEKYFSLVITRDQVTRGKPHPEPYLKALAGLNIRADEALVVENAPAGIESAKKAGIACVALTTTLAPHYLKAADFILDGHEALAGWLKDKLFR